MNNTPDVYYGAVIPIAAYDKGFAITPSDANDLPNVTRAIYVGGAGNLSVELKNGVVLTFTAVPVGTVLPIRAAKVRSTLTTASLLVGLF